MHSALAAPAWELAAPVTLAAEGPRCPAPGRISAAVSRGVSSSPLVSSLALLTDLPVGSGVGSAAAVLLCPP